MPAESKKPRVAIACQGGGSHAAFAAGVLYELLSTRTGKDFELVGLSGTSGGAMCASVAWSALLRTGQDRLAAAKALKGFWDDLTYGPDLLDAFGNILAVWYVRQPFAVEMPPMGRGFCEPALRTLIRKHVKLRDLPDNRFPPHLLVGTTDIETGQQWVVSEEELTEDALIASAAVPPLFQAIDAGKRLCWDGLFSCNPPVREFLELDSKPSEIWVIQINPQESHKRPLKMGDIVDRRNELSGNLSLNEELFFIDRVNKLMKDHKTLAQEYDEITLRLVHLANGPDDGRDAIDDDELDYPSKLDRGPQLIGGLFERGRKKAGQFFEDRSLWPPKNYAHSRLSLAARQRFSQAHVRRAATKGRAPARVP